MYSQTIYASSKEFVAESSEVLSSTASHPSFNCRCAYNDKTFNNVKDYFKYFQNNNEHEDKNAKAF